MYCEFVFLPGTILRTGYPERGMLMVKMGWVEVRDSTGKKFWNLDHFSWKKA